jgi:hypothetical protein
MWPRPGGNSSYLYDFCGFESACNKKIVLQFTCMAKEVRFMDMEKNDVKGI